MSGWCESLAMTWTNNVPPSRPSVQELCLYTQYLRQVQKQKLGKLNLLVLGSTPEFRDWGYEEDLTITIVDKNPEYFKCISRELRHKNIEEKLIVSSWEDMRLEDSYDIIIGDLAVGNIDPNRLDDFLLAVSSALTEDGLFIGKSFFWEDTDIAKNPDEIIADYRKTSIHPYTFINHQLGLYCLDKESCTIDFSRMYYELIQLKESGHIDEHTFSYFQNVGWNTDMKFTFFAPSRNFFSSSVNKYMQFEGFKTTDDIFSYLFPIYVARKRRS